MIPQTLSIMLSSLQIVGWIAGMLVFFGLVGLLNFAAMKILD